MTQTHAPVPSHRGPAMTAQTATQTCGECYVTIADESSLRGLGDTIVPCPLHAQAEETVKERDALLDILRLAIRHGGVTHECSPECHDWRLAARAAIAAAQPKHSQQEATP